MTSNNKRTVFYPIDVQDWGDGVPEIVEYLRITPFDDATDCCTFCRRKKIEHYTVEEQEKEKVFFDDDIDWMWKTNNLEIKEV